MIVVTGANGTVGGEIVRQLADGGHPVRAVVRAPERAAGLPEGVERALADFAHLDRLREACTGAEAVFMASFEHPEMARLQGNLITAAAEAEVRVVVRLSGLGASPDSRSPYMLKHGLADGLLMRARLGYAILKPNWFDQNFLTDCPGGVIRVPAGDSRTSFVDVRDIAAVAVKVLTEPGWENAAYELTGPAALTHAEAARILSEASGRRYVFDDVSDADWRTAAIAGGAEPAYADGLIGLYRLMREGATEAVTGDVERVTGRPPIAFERFARDHAEALAAQA